MRKLYNPFLQTSRLLLKIDLVKFIIAGVLSVMIEFAVLILFVEHFHFKYLTANSIAFIITNIFNYILSRVWVFKKSNKRIRYEIFLFFTTTLIGLLINQAIMWFMAVQGHFNYLATKLLAIIIVVLWNFWTKKFLVFSNIQKNVNV